MDQLAFQYMEMCKVESSTDSDSEISPRWSDTSTMGCVGSTPDSGTFRRSLPLTRMPAGRHGCYSLFLDPYDGSSEDSDESTVDVSSRQTRQQGKSGGGGRFLGRGRSRSRRFILHQPASALREVTKNGMRDPVTEQQHLLDVQMQCGSDSERCVCDITPSHRDRDGCRDLAEETANDSTMHNQTMDIEMHCPFNDSGLRATMPSSSHLPGPVTPVEGASPQRLDSSSETSPGPRNLRSVHKRKLGFPEADVGELGQRKRQCVVHMDDEQKERDSASEPCSSHLIVD